LVVSAAGAAVFAAVSAAGAGGVGWAAAGGVDGVGALAAGWPQPAISTTASTRRIPALRKGDLLRVCSDSGDDIIGNGDKNAAGRA
jgi:hypothetical protein